jgi:hypothetical protein
MAEARPTNYRHGAAYSGRIQPEYRAWTNLRYICRKAAQDAEPGTPVPGVCPEWDRSYSAFRAAVGARPSPQHILQRHDPQGNWEPGNVFWGPRKPPTGHQRHSSRFIEVEGRRVAVVDIAAARGLKSDTLIRRLDRGWPIEQALSPVRSSASRGARS